MLYLLVANSKMRYRGWDFLKAGIDFKKRSSFRKEKGKGRLDLWCEYRMGTKSGKDKEERGKDKERFFLISMKYIDQVYLRTYYIITHLSHWFLYRHTLSDRHQIFSPPKERKE